MDEIDRLIESANEVRPGLHEVAQPLLGEDTCLLATINDQMLVPLAVHQSIVRNWIEEARDSARDEEIMMLRCFRVIDIAAGWRHSFQIACYAIGALCAVIVGLAVVLSQMPEVQR